MKKERIDSLDSLRGISAFIVVVFHCLLSFNVFYEANYHYKFENNLVGLFTLTPLHTLWAGKEAVLLFFVLSGFVLMIPYTNNNKPNYFSYMIKRICRIYLPYIIIMILSVVLTTLFWQSNNLEELSNTYQNRWDHEVSLKAILAYLAMINFDTANVNGVVWTLFIEMKISLILPIFLITIAKLNWKKGLLVSVLINTIMLLTIEYVFKYLTFIPIKILFLFFNGTFYYAYFFIIGAILAKQRKVFKKSSLSKLVKWLMLIITLIFINSRWVSYLANTHLEHLENAFTVLGFVFLFILALGSKKFGNILTTKPLLFLGRISYSLYLIHIPVLMLTTIFFKNVFPLWLSFCLVPIFSILAAFLSYKWIEKPSMELGRKLSMYSDKKLFNRKKDSGTITNAH